MYSPRTLCPVLTWQSPRHIDGVRVQLRVTQSIAILDSQYNYVASSWEDSTVMHKVLEIGVPRRLSKQNPARDVSRSQSRNRSPTPAPYGGGGRHNDSKFRNMVRGVSRGRTPRILGKDHPISVEASSRSQSTAALSRDGRCSPADGASSPHQRRSGSAMSSLRQSRAGTPVMTGMETADLDEVTHLLEQSTVRGGERDGYSPQLVPSRPPSVHLSGEFRGRNPGPRPLGDAAQLDRVQDLDLETDDEATHRGRSKGKRREASVERYDVGDDEDGLELSKGVHAFEFAFILPSDSPPYERSPFGKVRYSIKATVLGAGRAHSNVEEWRDFFPTVNPAPDGGPTPMSVLYNDIHATVGLLSVACTSNNISVGGLFNIDIHSPAPPPDLIVYMVRVSLYTTIELHTRRKGKQTVPTQRRKLFEKGFVPPQVVLRNGHGHDVPGLIRYAGNDNAWTVQGLARIPDDNAIRPSTMPGTRVSIRFSHMLVVEVVHSRDGSCEDALTADGKRKLKVFTLRQNVTIPSCCCALDAVTLPPYSAEEQSGPIPHLNHGHDDSTWDAIVAANRDPGESHNMCVCGLSLADLSAAERALLPPPDPTDLLLDRVRHTGKVGELTPEQAAGGSPMFQGDDGGSPVGWRDRDPTPSPLALSSTAPSSQPPAYSLDGA